ncbi:MAG: DUF4390 domain-containing protein [Betaproteobacteria bacterium]
MRWARSALALLLVLLLSVLCLPGARAAEPIQLRLERADDGIYLSANLRLEIAPSVEDALSKGIPLIFVAEAEVYRERWYWTDKRVAQASRTMRLAFQPLTRRWRLSLGSTDGAALRVNLTQQFDTLADALAALESLARWRIADAADIEPGSSHELIFRFRLDPGQLPRPFQIGIAGQKDWQILIEQRQPLRLLPRRAGDAAEAARP